jgi:signal recognition particle subunit SRP54
MFDSLNKRLSSIFSGLRRKGALTEEDINGVVREVRIALLEADVALPVVKEFITSLKEKAVGAHIVESVSPAQMVIKLVHDHLADLLGAETQDLNLAMNPPAVLLMVGLQGSGKTTSSGKLALRLRTKQNKKVMVASLDVQRPAAQEQLAVVAKQAGVESLPIIAGQSPIDITTRALQEAKLGGFDVLILDTAGRLHIDDALMAELRAVKDLARPIETLLVADSLTGQDAVSIGRQFHETIGLTGIILTRIDGDARGGAALSMRHVTGQPIKFMGTGEKLDQLEPFHPQRIAGRILDMGDVVSLVERAAEAVDQKEAEALGQRMMQGKFDLNDLLSQFRNMKKMGGLGSMMSMLPGMGQMKDKLDGVDMEGGFKKQEAIILSMTPNERQFPKLLNASRKARIAAGSGTSVAEVNRLLKQHQQMETVMKRLKKMGKKGMARGGMAQLMQGLR